MDIPRGKEVARQRMIRRALMIVAGILLIGGTTFALNRLKPAAPTVERGTIWVDAAKRGPMEIQVRGLGRLTPEAILFLPALSDGRVEKIVRRPGVEVKANDVVMVLNNPNVQIEAENALWEVRQAEATLADTKVKLESAKLDQSASLAQLESDFSSSRLTADRDMELTKLGLQSDLTSRLSVAKANELNKRLSLQRQRLDISEDSIKAQMDTQKVLVEKARAGYELKKQMVGKLTIRAGVDGVLQEVPVEVGQQVAAGTILAKVAQPTKLKAELKIPETQMKDIRIGQEASIDTRNGLITGHVIRIDPAALNGSVIVDVKLESALPPGSRPELSVDGTIEIERVPSILFIGRPVSGQPDSTVGLFKLDADGRYASHVNVKLGRTSVNTIEVLSGLKAGDQVILSDMSQWDSQPRIRLN